MLMSTPVASRTCLEQRCLSPTVASEPHWRSWVWQVTREGQSFLKKAKHPVSGSVQAHIQLKGVRLRVPLMPMELILSLAVLVGSEEAARV